MSYSATGPDDTLSAGARRQNAISLLLFLLILVVLIVRFCVSPQLMNMVMDYTAETGAFYEKLHFGTYGILLLLPLALFIRPIFLRGGEIDKFKALVRFVLLTTLMVALLIVTGRAGASGFFIDTYVAAGAAGLLMYTVNEHLRRLIGDVILFTLLLSAAIAIGEAATETRLLPYMGGEDVFRPIGLAEHPLTLGTMCAAGIGFVAVTNWRTYAKVAAILLLFVGCAAAGARFALLLAAAEIFIMVLFVPWRRLSPKHERQAKAVVLLLTLVGGGLLVALLLASGFLSRFGDTIFDESAMARITIYQVFDYVTFKDIMLGANISDIVKIANEKLNLPYVESTPVVLIFQLGLPLALFFAGLVYWIYQRMLRFADRPALIGTLIFILTALSNNTLSTKTPTVAIFIVLLAAYGNATPRTPDRLSGAVA